MMKSYLLKKEFFINNHKDQIKDHFEFIRELGRGAYGVVYMAKQRVFPNRLRVIKRISKRKVKDPTMLINQLKIAACLDHPHIIKIYETFEDQSSLFLVLDYCEGGELYERLCEQKIFTEGKARSIFRQMVNTVRYMHAKKVAHRDLKLQNFMMVNKESWELMLIDFGLSFQWKQDMKSQVLRAQKGKIIGTPYYISPEILKEHYSQKCDIWSLGVILYMLVTGTPPFDGKNDQEIMQNISKFNYSLKTKQCEFLTPELKNLLSQIFKPEAQRISLEQILSHPWLGQQKRAEEILLYLDFNQLMQFTKFAKLKKIVATYIASQLSEMQIETMRDLFENIDHDDDGYITINELHEFLSKKQGQSVALSDLSKLVLSIDTDRNGKINYNEFLAMCIDEAIMSNENYLQFAFNSFDLNRDGKIQREEFKTILKSYSKDFNCNQELVDALMLQNDKNQDGAIDYSQFRDAMISVQKTLKKQQAMEVE